MDHYDHQTHVHPSDSPKEYYKFALIILGILVVSVSLTTWRGGEFRQFLNDFMAVFFLVFGLFKLVNLKLFALTYQSYDIIAKRSILWAYMFPFIELALGLAYLATTGPVWLNVATLAITGIASVGVLRELTKKSKIMCACLGTVIRLPLSKISFVEDVLMFAMAVAMIAT